MKIRILTTALALMALAPAWAQSRFERMERRNLWNDGINAAGIRQDTASLSVASMTASYQAGDYRTISQSENEWSAGAQAKSVKHLENYSMKGSFSFLDTEASNMCGSMFLDPGFFPVDVYEFTPGHKTFQTYSVNGIIAVDLAKSLKIGTGLDFKARNAAKRKDLRYSTYRLDMAFNPSLIYSAGKVDLGAALHFARNTETISAEQTGTAAVAPFAFFDEGLALGNWQVWTGNGSRLKESGVNGLPVVQNTYGGSLQIALADGSLYADADFRWLNGSVGERQVIWYRYSGPQFQANLSGSVNSLTYRTHVALKRIDNRETVQDKVTEGGISLVHEYGSNRIFSSLLQNVGDELEYVSGAFDAVVNFDVTNLKRIAAPMYPLIYTRNLRIFETGIRSGYRRGRFEYGLNVCWKKGFAEDGQRSVSEVGSASAPYRHDDVWTDQCKFETSDCMMAGLLVDWNFSGRIHALMKADGQHSWDMDRTRYCITTGLYYIF